VENKEHAMSFIPDNAIVENRLGALPLVTYQAGENVLTAGSRTGRLLILKKGAVAIVKETIEIARVSEPGADASALLLQDPLVLLYVATVLARRLDAANQALIELKSRVQAGQPRSEIGEAIDKVEGVLYRYFRLFE
jgi:hypothetical protein